MPGFAAAAAESNPPQPPGGASNFLHRRYRKIIGPQQLHDSADRLKWLSFFGNNFRGVLRQISRNRFFGTRPALPRPMPESLRSRRRGGISGCRNGPSPAASRLAVAFRPPTIPRPSKPHSALHMGSIAATPKYSLPRARGHSATSSQYFPARPKYANFASSLSGTDGFSSNAGSNLDADSPAKPDNPALPAPFSDRRPPPRVLLVPARQRHARQVAKHFIVLGQIHENFEIFIRRHRQRAPRRKLHHVRWQLGCANLIDRSRPWIYLFGRAGLLRFRHAFQALHRQLKFANQPVWFAPLEIPSPAPGSTKVCLRARR